MNTFIKLIYLSILVSAPAHAMQNDAELGKQLLAAAETGDLKEIARLISTGAPVDYLGGEGRTAGGSTALMNCARAEHLDCVQILIAAGAQANHKNVYGTTALMRAAEYNILPCAKALIEAGAQVNLADKHGWTALMLAAHRGNQPFCELLVERMLWIPNQKQKTKICIFVDSLKKQKAMSELYRNCKALFKRHLAQAIYEQNRNNFANSIAYQELIRIKALRLMCTKQIEVLLEKYNPGGNNAEPQSWCSVQ